MHTNTNVESDIEMKNCNVPKFPTKEMMHWLKIPVASLM